ncbi:hypothetical protein CFBP5507_25120 (plasmid) [Agrobacterium salinitolerans]|uniref:Uncharacterized protein n=1 Tax=Agrobacterium salinitolerans TaxID=1183413 RepID=A0A9X9KHJ5_9HYPH|nr:MULTISPECIES: hypothetical protein [Agrobacterium]MDH6298075.1 hypothetical protein [Agrobacterium fabrum]UYZ11106.1 hypothetical protein CFBP5507_25120 [Agrobacterium salinitolerans]
MDRDDTAMIVVNLVKHLCRGFDEFGLAAIRKAGRNKIWSIGIVA